MPEEKTYTRQVTDRFLQELDRIIGYDGNTKTTTKDVAEKVGITSNNITRLRKRGNNYVTIEACCKLCDYFGTDPGWLLMGKEPAGKEAAGYDFSVIIRKVNQHDKTLKMLLKKAQNGLSNQGHKSGSKKNSVTSRAKE